MRNLIYQEFPKKRRFGVEFELSNNLSKNDIGAIVDQYEFFYGINKRSVKVTPGLEGWAQTRNNSYWHVKFDRTCGPLGKNFDYGWEIASYIGSDITDVDHISRLARYLKNTGAETNLNCGLHIHVEVEDFNELNMSILLARWCKIEPILTSICHMSRHDNKYCRPIRSKLKNWQKWYTNLKPELVWNNLKPKNLTIHNNNEKRVALNTVGFATGLLNPNHNRKTVELRLPEFVLDEIHVKNWIRLIVCFVDSSRKHDCVPVDLTPCCKIEDILNYLGLSSDKDFFILSHELFNTKIWFLNKIINCCSNQKTIVQAKKYLEFVTLL